MDVQLAKKFADLLQQRVEDYYKKFSAASGSDKDYHIHEQSWQVRVKPGKNYIKIDVGSSGKFMVDENNGLYFIKGYGVINKKKYFGKLENLIKDKNKWWYDGYSISPLGKAGKYGYAGQISELRQIIRQEIVNEEPMYGTTGPVPLPIGSTKPVIQPKADKRKLLILKLKKLIRDEIRKAMLVDTDKPDDIRWRIKDFQMKEFSAKAHGKKSKTWNFTSKSNPSKKYETVKWQDGTYSCNCPGWTRRVTNGKRVCRHVTEVGGKAAKA